MAPSRESTNTTLLSVLTRRAPHSNLLKLPNETQRFHVTMRLHTAAENGENFCVRWGEKFCRRGRDCCGSHFGDQAAVHDCERRARFWIDKKNCRHVSRNSALRIRRIERHSFQAEPIRS